MSVLFRFGRYNNNNNDVIFQSSRKIFYFVLLSLLCIPFNKKALKGKIIQQNQTLSQCLYHLRGSLGNNA